NIHGDNPIQNRKKILILGGGFGGVAVLNKLQERFQTDVSVDIAIVSKDNYLLFTPMLHEIASGMIETRHIVTPIRTFCNRSRFYCASVESIDLENKKVQITSSLAPLLHDVQHSIDSIERNSKYLENKKVQITSSLAPLLHDVQHSIDSIERNSKYL